MRLLIDVGDVTVQPKSGPYGVYLRIGIEVECNGDHTRHALDVHDGVKTLSASAELHAPQVQDLRDLLTEWLQENGRP
jgi:hypothetical protein